MVDNNDNNQMTAEDFDQIVQQNPPAGTENNTGTEDDAQQTQTQTQTGAGDNQAQQGATGEGSTEPNTQQQNNNAGDTGRHNANNAFAEMRVTNRKLQNALAAVLQQHNMDPNLASDPDALVQQAENARLEAEAQKQKVPADLLKRLTQLEKANKENEQQRLSNLALAGFQAVKEKYKLDDKGLSEFARQLQDAGTNPFEQEMDLDKQYRLLNLDKIIAEASQKAVEEALKKQNTAAQHSTTPSQANGKDNTGTEQIDTMAKLDRLILSLNK